MKLKEYLKREKMTAVHLARHLDCHPQTVRSYMNGDRFPSYTVAKAIEQFSNGEVTIDELMKEKLTMPKCPYCNRTMWRHTKHLKKEE